MKRSDLEFRLHAAIQCPHLPPFDPDTMVALLLDELEALDGASEATFAVLLTLTAMLAKHSLDRQIADLRTVQVVDRMMAR